MYKNGNTNDNTSDFVKGDPIEYSRFHQQYKGNGQQQVQSYFYVILFQNSYPY